MKVHFQFWKGRRLDPLFLNSKATYWRVIRLWRFVVHLDMRPKLIPIE